MWGIKSLGTSFVSQLGQLTAGSLNRDLESSSFSANDSSWYALGFTQSSYHLGRNLSSTRFVLHGHAPMPYHRGP